jgi:hypothetical protein
LLLATMTASAVALPGLFHLPRWIEAEMVIGIWWVGWVVALTVLLHRGWRLSDDHVLTRPELPWSSDSGRRSSSWGWTEGCSYADGCAEGTALLILVGVLVAAWLAVELVVPALFFLLYLLIRSALARAANDRHGCDGHLGRALLWGAAWATAYSVPLLIVVSVLHAFSRH